MYIQCVLYAMLTLLSTECFGCIFMFYKV